LKKCLYSKKATILAIMTPQTLPTMMPISVPLARPDEDDEEAKAVDVDEDSDVPVAFAAAKVEDEDVKVAVVVVEEKSEELRQSDWQPYSTKQYVALYPQYPFFPQQTGRPSGKQREPLCCHPHSPFDP